jgi:hypothetical protein
MVSIILTKKLSRRITVLCTLAMSLFLAYSANSRAQESTEATKPLLRITTQPFEKTAQNHEVYFFKVLELALAKTEATDGPYELDSLKEVLSNKRYLAELRRDDGILDIIWTMNDAERERDLRPVKISLLRGMNSYRIFLIRTQDKEKFAGIKSLEDLMKLKAGSGTVWPDTPILQANGLHVITSAHYESLFNMLVHKRFDYFPRGVYEVWNEHSIHGHRGVTIEEHLMFHYPAPIYFFVNKKNQALADRIKRGLDIAIADGSFDTLFFSIPGFARGYEEMNKNSRTIFHLKTPFPMED